MATAYKCDRCGELFVRETFPKLRVIKTNCPWSDTRYDLCDECQAKLEEFMANKENKEKR